MIINKDINPRRQVYYLAGVILHAFVELQTPEVQFFDLFESVNKKEPISITLFAYALDWLYLLGAVSAEGPLIKRCS